MKIVIPTQEQIEYFLKYFRYDPVFGELYGKRGKKIGTKSEGYVRIQGPKIVGQKKRQYFAHHVCWLLYYGYWPTDQIDHKDVNGYNNRLLNLREADHNINCNNKKNSNDLLPGVQIRKRTKGPKKYYTYISHKNKRYGLGSSTDEIDAFNKYKKKYKELTGREYLFE